MIVLDTSGQFNGTKRGELTVIMAQSGVGKTAFNPDGSMKLSFLKQFLKQGNFDSMLRMVRIMEQETKDGIEEMEGILNTLNETIELEKDNEQALPHLLRLRDETLTLIESHKQIL